MSDQAVQTSEEKCGGVVVKPVEVKRFELKEYWVIIYLIMIKCPIIEVIPNHDHGVKPHLTWVFPEHIAGPIYDRYRLNREIELDGLTLKDLVDATNVFKQNLDHFKLR